MDRVKIRGLYGQIAVVDNNIICDLCELDCLQMLNILFSEVMIPQSILEDEVIEFKSELKKLIYTPVSITEFKTYEFLGGILQAHGGLTSYDAELVSIAYEKCVLCTSNEKRIKTTCEENDIQYTGTLGILCLAYEKNIITKDGLNTYINRLQNECTCFLSARVVNVVRKAYALCS